MEEEKSKIQIVGCLNWKQFRDYLIKKLQKMSTEEELSSLIKSIVFATSSSEEEMQEKRRRFGIPET